MTCGEAAKRCRMDAGLSIKALAKLSGISYPMICFIENDQRNPSIVTVEALADTLGVSIDQYVGHKIKRRYDERTGKNDRCSNS